MKVAFKAVPYNRDKVFSVSLDGPLEDFLDSGETASLSGSMRCLDRGLVRLTSVFSCGIGLVCSLTGEQFFRNFSHDLALYFSDGVFDSSRFDVAIDALDVVEFFEGFVNLADVIRDEVIFLKSDYHILGE